MCHVICSDGVTKPTGRMHSRLPPLQRTQERGTHRAADADEIKSLGHPPLIASFWLIWVIVVLSFPPATFAGLPSAAVTRVLTSLSAPRNVPASFFPLANVTNVVVVTVVVVPSAFLVVVCCVELNVNVFCAEHLTLNHGRPSYKHPVR